MTTERSKLLERTRIAEEKQQITVQVVHRFVRISNSCHCNYALTMESHGKI